MSDVTYQWHPDVVADFRELPEDVRAAYLEQIQALQVDPRLGEHLDRRASTGDRSAFRKLKFGRDTPRGPSHRIVYQLLPDDHSPSRFRVLAVRSRNDVYERAARRLADQAVPRRQGSLSPPRAEPRLPG